jgi:hypothetical protein
LLWPTLPPLLPVGDRFLHFVAHVRHIESRDTGTLTEYGPHRTEVKAQPVIADLLQDPQLRAITDVENIVHARQIPGLLAEKFGNYNEHREQISAIGRMSRDLREPFSAIERGFDSMDAIMELVKDWAAVMKSVESAPGDALPGDTVDNQPSSPAAQTD